jgi:small conductance mechanosensitive channel
VFRNAATMVIIAGGILMLLDEVNIPIAPLMGGAAVFGLAVAFGAQSLIKDFFSGFMILLEQQYMVNDVIKIGDISGQVERITLRTTVLRDMEGRVHFVPHGQITSTTNMTHGWSRAVFDIPVSYREDVDHLIDVLVALGKQLRRDPEFGPLILEDPVMLGIDSFSDTAVMVKFYLKTRPLRQWPVKRELLRRIKVCFDEMGIEIPNRGVPAPAASPKNLPDRSRQAA